MISYTYYGIPIGREAAQVSEDLGELADLYHRLASLGQLAESLLAAGQDPSHLIQQLDLELARRDLIEAKVLAWVSLLGLAPQLLGWLRDELALRLDHPELPATEADLIEQIDSYNQQLQSQDRWLTGMAISQAYRRLRHYLLIPYQ